MNKTVHCLLVLTVMTTIFINVCIRAAIIPEGDGFELYNPDDADQMESFLPDIPQKRMGCRNGFTYQAILRDCVPSLGELRSLAYDGGILTMKRIYKALRGRGRGRGRGRFRS